MYKIAYFFLKSYWFVFRPKTYGVKCVIWNNDMVLLVKHSYGQEFWTFPGGGVKRNEETIKTMEREVWEEVALKIENVKQVGEFISTKEYKKDRVSVFSATVEKPDFTIDSCEIIEAQWFNTENLPQISEYAQKILIMLDS